MKTHVHDFFKDLFGKSSKKGKIFKEFFSDFFECWPPTNGKKPENM